MSQFAKTRQTPSMIAKDTFVIHDHEGEGTDPVQVPLNSMVIRAAEPVVVDTGMAENRQRYLEDVFSIVDPEDVRWVFISHDDVDHTGNVNALMEAAPNATLIINWFMTKRMGESLEVPLHRQRWLGDGESFSAGDRTLYAVRPPIFDSPTTRGLFDPKSGVYWGSDSFATPMIGIHTHVDALDPEFWAGGIATFAKYISPWTALVDEQKFLATVDRVERLGATALAGCHTPIVDGSYVAKAFAHMKAFLHMEVPPEPGQAVLEEILATITAAA